MASASFAGDPRRMAISSRRTYAGLTGRRHPESPDLPAFHGLGAIVAAVRQHRLFVSGDQGFQHRMVRDAGRRDFHRPDNALRIRRHTRLHPKVPLVAFLRLVHLRIPVPILIPGGTRRVNHGWRRPFCLPQTPPPLSQNRLHLRKNGRGELLPFQQAPEFGDGRLIRDKASPQTRGSLAKSQNQLRHEEKKDRPWWRFWSDSCV